MRHVWVILGLVHFPLLAWVFQYRNAESEPLATAVVSLAVTMALWACLGDLIQARLWGKR